LAAEAASDAKADVALRSGIPPLLEVHEIHTAYGKVRVLDSVSLEVWPGEIVSIIGPNGAGKSTVLKSVMGILKPMRGEVVFDGKPITGLRTDLAVHRGIAYVPQGRIVFKAMSVVENLEMGAYTVKDKAQVRRTMERVFAFFPRLGERRNQKAGTMSGGEQQMLAMGRALMVEPRLVLLDEPSLGLAPLFVEIVFDKLRELNASGMTLLLVEQNAAKSLSISDRGYVLELGRNRFTGRGVDLLAGERVRRLYLGG
jgi:branched-chain amino acid transport system ATP-binding protein